MLLIRFSALRMSARSSVPSGRMNALAAASSAFLAAQRHLFNRQTVSPSVQFGIKWVCP